MTVSVLWFRRDLRLADNPALRAAMAAADQVLALFVVDPVLYRPAGSPRLVFLNGCLRALDAEMGGRLTVLAGRPERVVADVVRRVRANSVHLAADFGPYGAARDARVEQALGDVPMVRTGSPYAVPPGAVAKPDGSGYRVFTPYLRGWYGHGWPDPTPRPRTVAWAPDRGNELPAQPAAPTGQPLPVAGERAGRARWRRFAENLLAGYDRTRDRPGADATSRLSPYLRWGCLHPRTLLADLDDAGRGAQAFARQLAWRDFYADVLWHSPDAARRSLLPRMRQMCVDQGRAADALFAAWAAGRTGYPIVDAGMRQLRAEGWMHNRIRLITASFLVKDLHLDWTRGARHFMHWLVDADLASNQLGWQWVAGTGSEASPFHRVISPLTQARRFDPTGDYVRHHVPELRGVTGGAVHQPWDLPGGPPEGYPGPVVEHVVEAQEALSRYRELRRS